MLLNNYILCMTKPGVQLALFDEAKRKRRRRKRKNRRARVPHRARPEFRANQPLHVTLRVVSEIGNPRKRHFYHAIRWATMVTAKREDFRIVQLSLQHDHVHLIVEAMSKQALSAGMHGFE